jgi:hypothetical protein
MDRSRISAAIPDVTFVRHASAVGADAQIVVVDLARHGAAVPVVHDTVPEARIVAYGPHVDDASMSRATADGADVVMPRSRFFHDPAGAVARPA